MSALTAYVGAWSESGRRVIDLLSDLPDSAWTEPTDCPDWSVHDVAAHLAAIESELTGGAAPSGVELADERATPAAYTAAGVRDRVDLGPTQIIAELSAAYDSRLRDLADLPDDPSTRPPRTPGGVAWDTQTLLRNRAVDMWVHEQDIRRAVGSRGGLDGLAANVVVTVFEAAMPYVLGKVVRPPVGTTVVWEVRGPVPFELSVGIGEDGRARALGTTPDPATARLGLDTEAFTMLCAGRARDRVPVRIDGDRALGEQVVAAMSITG